MELPFLKMTPAPRKEMPLTTWAAMRAVSAPREPARAAVSMNAYLDRIMNTAEAQAMMQWVRTPASFWRLVRSRPMAAPRAADSRIRNRNSRLSYRVKVDSGKKPVRPVSIEFSPFYHIFSSSGRSIARAFFRARVRAMRTLVGFTPISRASSLSE